MDEDEERGAQPLSLPAASGQVEGRPGRLMGFAVRESSGAAGATFRLYSGGDANGQPVAPVSLSPNESTREWWGPNGVRCDAGLYFQLVGGSLEGVAYYEVDR